MSERVEELLRSQKQLRFEEALGDLEALALLLRNPGGPIVVSADDIVVLSPAMRNALPEDGQEVYLALKPKADAAREAVFQYLLRRPHAQEGTVVFTAGGPGSGKSSFAKGLPSAEFVYDSIFGNPIHAARMIRQTLATRRRVEVMLIVRDPIDAMRGNLERALTEKRVASADGMAEAHVSSRISFTEIAREFRDEPMVEIFAFENRSAWEFRPMHLAEVRLLSFDETRQRVHDALNEIAERVDRVTGCRVFPEYVIRAAKGRQRESESDCT